MISVSALFEKVSATLLDRSRRAWSTDDLVDYVNLALEATANVKADFYPVQNFVPLVAGTLQAIPDDGVSLMEIDQNEVSGRIVTQADYSLLQESNRFWPAGTRELDVENYCADPRNPKRFIVSPPNNGSGSIRMLYGAIPPRVVYPEETIDVPASYEPALYAYMLARAYMKNTKRADPAKAQGYMAEWGNLLGLRTKQQVAVAPKTVTPPGAAA